MKNLERRYYQPVMSTKGRLQSLLQAKVIETATLRKHDKVRRDVGEKEKLDRIAKELDSSEQL